MKPLPFTNGFYESAVLPFSAQRCVNWFPYAAEAPALSLEALFGTPGAEELLTTGNEANRGGIVKDGIPYFVNGSKLYRLDRTISSIGGAESSTFSTTELGTISGTGFVSIDDNVNQIMLLVPGGAGYIYNVTTSTFSTITDADFVANGAPQLVQFIDGYFVCTTDEKKVIASDLNDGTSWNALMFGTAESDPDKVVAPVVTNNQLYIVGSVTTEGFQTIGGVGFPFIRNNVFLSKGCAAPFTLVEFNATFYMVGKGKKEHPAIWKFIGSGFEKISTDAIDTIVQSYSDSDLWDKTFATTYSQNGKFFVCFNFPNHTFVYELMSKKWHERSSIVAEVPGRWRHNAILFAYEQMIATDSIDGRVGTLSLDVYDEYDNPIIREIATQPFYNEGNAITSTAIRLVMESGVGDLVTRNPQVSLALSKNGKVYGPERLRSIGKMGEFNRQVVWNRNGRFPSQAVLQFKMSDPVKANLLKLEFE